MLPVREAASVGAAHLLARIVSRKLAERIGKPVVVENKPGADAIIATEYMAKAAPDGYALMVGASGAMVINPGIYDRLPYDPVKDFIPIKLFASIRQVLTLRVIVVLPPGSGAAATHPSMENVTHVEEPFN